MRYDRGKCLLKLVLRRKGMSQAELSRRTGINYSQLNGYANDRNEMKVSEAKSIMSELDCDLDDLYEFPPK
ncbi:helix-turn-helix domain-containing protein [Alteribacter populi]|uniref:helix-turn-helix domain-containing protein n=1 Tax=Alteribacter populi TaxID=2011011 RepID=UPI000BBA4393|nr:helix-turn-helix transcriptional regulator [Alteribacter populi]